MSAWRDEETKEINMADYTITFMPLRAAAGAQPYVLSIGGGTGTAIPLQPGEQPFTTQESDDEDMFVPIRTQTGYFRIVDDGKDINGNAFDWKDLIPATDTSRPVTLTRGGTVVWRGFMQAQDFGSVLYGNPQEREFPVQCVLSVLGGSDINYTQTAIQNFAYLLKQIVDAIPSAYRPTEFYIQGGTDAQEWLLKRIDWQNFVSEDADGLTARFTMYQCLEDMCRFWGWTARTKGTAMYLTCADDINQTMWLELTYAELEQLAAYSGAILVTSVPFETASLSGDIFASTSNDEYVQRGVKKATVSADGNKADTKIIEIYPDSIVKQMRDGGSYVEGGGGFGGSSIFPIVRYTNDKTSIDSAFLGGTARSGYATFNVMDLRKDAKDLGDTHNVIKINKSFSSTSAQAYAHLYTKYQHALCDGYFSLLGCVYKDREKYEDYVDGAGVGNKNMYIRLGIGENDSNAQWYNGTSWSNTKTAFKVKIGNQEDKFLSNVKMPTTANGYLFIDFLGSDDIAETDGQRTLVIADLSFEFNRTNKYWDVTHTSNGNFASLKTKELNDKCEYKSSNSNKTPDEWNTDCIYASDNNMNFGFGVLLNADGSYMKGYNYGGLGLLVYPEQHLADRATSFWQTSRRRLAVELRRGLIADITPRHKLTIDGMTGYPIAISHEWRDDITQLTILQL